MTKQQELELIGYCLVCKEKRAMQDPQPEWAANGTPATRGACPVCGTTIYKRGHTPAHDTLPKPETDPAAKKSKKRSKKLTAKKTTAKKAAAKKTVAGKVSAKQKSAATGDSRSRSGRLVVVESPAKARTIGRYLGRGYRVMSSVGHVRDLLKSRLSVDIEHNFEPEYRVPNDKRKVVKELTEAAATAKEIYLATDPDREGEAIAWHVQESAEMDPGRTHRVVFQEITKPAIIAAFEHPREIDMDRVNAQQARRILDRLVGYKLSPLLWRKVRGRLSAGRVQSVAVRLIVEREREIEDFEPEEYWTLEAELSQQAYRDDEPRPFFTARFHQYQGQEPVLSSEQDVLPHLEALERAEWTVGDVRLGTRTRRPAPPFTTSTLQQEASRKVNFGTTKTMRIAQQLYEGVDIGQEGTTGLITYMRTDSLNVAKEAQQEARAHIIRHFGSKYVPNQPPVYKTKSKTAQEAHEAVRPTQVEHTPKKMKSFLSRDQYRLYQLIWERFVASQMAPAVYDTVSADIMAGRPGSVPAERPICSEPPARRCGLPVFWHCMKKPSRATGRKTVRTRCRPIWWSMRWSTCCDCGRSSTSPSRRPAIRKPAWSRNLRKMGSAGRVPTHRSSPPSNHAATLPVKTNDWCRRKSAAWLMTCWSRIFRTSCPLTSRPAWKMSWTRLWMAGPGFP
jgi:DNA topoisomerase I